MFKKTSKAFTLIELLVVIAIIGILATISVLALSNARAKSRDAKRAGDVKQVQTALELFFNDNNRYPTAEEWNTGKIYSTTTGATSTYMQIIPLAPTPADGSCSDNQNAVNYIPTDDGSSYSLSFCLGNNTGALSSGPKCLTPGGIIDFDCSPCVDASWSPEPGDACVGQTITQTSNCGNTRDVDGTGVETWSPDPSTVCIGQTLDQDSNCGNTRTVDGTALEVWAPDLDTVCGTVKQSSNCGNARKTSGTLVCSSPQVCNSNVCVTPYACGTATVSDADGNSYQTVLINDQCWTKSNLKTTKYNDGSSIDYPLDDTSWQANTAGAYTWYDYNIGYKNTYGALYNWYAAVNPKGLCPTGWHVPSIYELDAMRSYLGGSSVAGGKLMIGGSSGFEMPLSGVRGGSFYNMGNYGYLWSATEYWPPSAYFRYINASSFDGFGVSENSGYSIRCLRDSLF